MQRWPKVIPAGMMHSYAAFRWNHGYGICDISSMRHNICVKGTRAQRVQTLYPIFVGSSTGTCLGKVVLGGLWREREIAGADR